MIHQTFYESPVLLAISTQMAEKAGNKVTALHFLHIYKWLYPKQFIIICSKKAVKTPKWLACLLLLKYVAQLNHW
jgi:hypothetical protein